MDYLDEYFRCLFVRVEETEQVMSANAKAREIFTGQIVDRNRNGKYMPHLSLMYGNSSPEVKEKIIGGVGRGFDVSFPVKSIHLFLTDGSPNAWKRIKKFDLG